MKIPTLLSIQVRLPKEFGVKNADSKNRPWSTGIFKEPVKGSIWLGRNTARLSLFSALYDISRV